MSHAQIVLHHEHRFLSGRHARKAWLFVRDRWSRIRHSRQINVCCRSLAKLAFEHDLPAVLADQPITGSKAETAAVAIVFRGKEGLENSCFYLFAHAAPVID